MLVDIGAHERALRHHRQPAIARAVERGADQFGRDALPGDHRWHDGMREDDRVAFPLIRRDGAVARDRQVEFRLCLVVAYRVHPACLHPDSRVAKGPRAAGPSRSQAEPAMDVRLSERADAIFTQRTLIIASRAG